MADLKYLTSLQQTSLFAFAEAEKIYKQLRSLAPLSSNLDKFEERVIEKAAPLVAKVQDSTEKLIKAADASVDTFVTTADARLGKLKAGAAPFLDLVLKAGDFVVEHLRVKEVQAATLRAVESARDGLHDAISQAKDVADPDVAVKMATDAWDRFAAIPAIAMLLSKAEPATKLGMQVFSALHDSLVHASVYKAAISKTTGTINYATSTTPYRLGAQYVYPLVSPYTDPAIAKVSQSKILNDMVEYWKPVTITSITAH